MIRLKHFPGRSLARLILISVVAMIAAGAATVAAAQPTVVGVRVGYHVEKTRIVVDLDQDVDFTIFTLPDPYRLVIDLPEVSWRMKATPASAKSGVVTRFRYGLFHPGTSRLVFDLTAPAMIGKRFMLPPSAGFGYRLVVDLVQVAAADYRPQGSPAATAVAVAKPAPPSPAPPRGGRPVVVIDAGHGGVDPGTIGISGVYEKDITLAAARDLAKALGASGKYRVVLTRDRDMFISLRRRVEIARAADAALFVSLHADTIADRRIRGAHVYTVSEQASDEVAAELASKENQADVVAGLVPSSEDLGDSVLNSILFDLMRKNSRASSRDFAALLVPEMARVAPLLRKAHREAGFRVLKAPDVPSVLIELGYLSNPKEERRLRDPVERRRLMRAVSRAVDRYFTKSRFAERS